MCYFLLLKERNKVVLGTRPILTWLLIKTHHINCRITSIKIKIYYVRILFKKKCKTYQLNKVLILIAANRSKLVKNMTQWKRLFYDNTLKESTHNHKSSSKD